MYRQKVSRLTLIASAALLAQIAAIKFAAAQVRPGELITAQDARKVEQLVSPGVYLRVTHGMSMQIAPSERIEWPPPYREATEKYSAQVRLSRDHRSLVGYVAGLPFPFIDPNDADAGNKVMWNNTFRPTSTDDYDARDFSCISEYEGLNRKYAPIDYYEMGHLASYNLVGRTEVEPLPTDPDFRTSGRLLLMAFYPMLAPETERGRGFIRYRYADPAEGDDTWSWNPGNRRIRRYSEATLGSAAGPITWSLDNFQGFAAKNENYNWRFLGEKPMLASIAAGHVPEVTCPTDGGASACPERWELRRTYVVEGVARRDRVPQELFGRHVMYIDAEAQCIVYQDLYDRGGELWKNYISWMAYRDRSVPAARVAIYPFRRVFQVGASIDDLKDGFATMCYLPAQDTAEHECWYINMGAVDKSFFTVQALTAAAP
ncbi:MAG: DUF1329 domain-containing protein [Candidatus Binatus sp.]